MNVFLQTYDLAGLTLLSDCPLQLPAVQSEGRTPDIVIRHGTIDDSGLARVESLEGWRINGEMALLSVEDVGRFLVMGDDRVTVEALVDATPAMVRSYLAGSVMGMLCHRRGILPLHASAVTIAENGVAAFVGRSGAGKSTMVAALARQGQFVLTDDVLFLRIGPRGEAMAWPGISRIRLWRDAIDAMALSVDEAARIARRLDKFEIYPQQRAARPEQHRLRRLFVLEEASGPDEEGITRLVGSKAVEAVWMNIYRRGLAQQLGRQAEIFAVAARIAADIEVFMFKRVRDLASLDAVVARIEPYLQSA